jgi:hypothetical protein
VAIYGLITKRIEILPFMLLSLAAALLVNGLSELQKNRKSVAYSFFIVSGFNILVSIFIFFN